MAWRLTPLLLVKLTEDMVAALGEATASPFFINKLRDTMLSDPTGRRILREQPRITSTSLDVEKLRLLPVNTIGHEYARWLEIEGVSPDTRAAVILDFGSS
jgi:ubiquinone biosynthesis protein COQ4